MNYDRIFKAAIDTLHVEGQPRDLNPLRADDRCTLEQGRLVDLDERHEVHPLVLRLVHEGTDTALVVAHAAQAPKMGQGCADHAGNGSHGLEHHGAMTITLGEEGVSGKSELIRTRFGQLEYALAGRGRPCC